MQLGMIGLGRMGSNMARRLMKGGHEAVVYDRDSEAIDALASEGATGARTLEEFVGSLTQPRAVWLMVPAGVTGRVVEEVSAHLDEDDVMVDGGNGHYHHDIEREADLESKGIHYVDCGTSGGVWGLERGYCLMIGGRSEIVERLDPIFKTLAPGVEAAERTPGSPGSPSRAEHGYLHCGPAGAGHFVKMVHNGIEYALMAAYAEGLNILAGANAGTHSASADAETAPLTNPELYRYDIDLAGVTEVWRRGSVVASWLLDITAAELAADPDLEGFSGRVSDSGEGRWTLQAAIDEGVPAHVISAALYNRFSSRGADALANRIQSAMRRGFGGHKERGG